MPHLAPKVCNYPGCYAKIKGGYCKEHTKKKARQREARRKTPNERGYTWKWRVAARNYLRQHPLCEHCLKEGILNPATVVDHIIPHQGDMDKFWDTNNLQAMAKSCHDRKTATEDGGFGRPLKTK